MKNLSILLIGLAATTGLAIAQSPDADNDGVPDAQDNCVNVANADQRNTDGDKFGNVCDADLDNDGAVDEADMALMKGVMNQEASASAMAAAADLDGDGTVTSKDFARMRAQVSTGPGPGRTP